MSLPVYHLNVSWVYVSSLIVVITASTPVRSQLLQQLSWQGSGLLVWRRAELITEYTEQDMDHNQHHRNLPCVPSKSLIHPKGVVTSRVVFPVFEFYINRIIKCVVIVFLPFTVTLWVSFVLCVATVHFFILEQCFVTMNIPKHVHSADRHLGCLLF